MVVAGSAVDELVALGHADGGGVGPEPFDVRGVERPPPAPGVGVGRGPVEVVDELVDAVVPSGGVAGALPGSVKVSTSVSIVPAPLAATVSTSMRITSVPQRNSMTSGGSNA